MATRKRENGTLVRSDLTRDEYAEIRKVAIDRGLNVGKLTGNHLRKLIPVDARAHLDADKQRRQTK